MKAERHIEGYAVSPVVALLMRARERVELAWCHWGQDRVLVGVCAMEAMNWDTAGHRYLAQALPKSFTPRLITRFNDHPTTTKADILSLYDRAIAMAIGESR